MRVRRVDEDGDMVFGGGQAAFHRDVPEAVAQIIRSRLNLWSGEWYLDLAEGTPYQTDVLGKYTERTRDPVIQARILGAPGVVELTTYGSTTDPQTRALSVAARVVTVYSALDPSGRESRTANLNTTVYRAR